MKNDPRSTVNPILCSCIRIRSLKKILGWVVQSRVTITPFVQNFNSHLNANSVLFFLTTICTMATTVFFRVLVEGQSQEWRVTVKT